MPTIFQPGSHSPSVVTVSVPVPTPVRPTPVKSTQPPAPQQQQPAPPPHPDAYQPKQPPQDDDEQSQPAIIMPHSGVGMSKSPNRPQRMQRMNDTTRRYASHWSPETSAKIGDIGRKQSQAAAMQKTLEMWDKVQQQGINPDDVKAFSFDDKLVPRRRLPGGSPEKSPYTHQTHHNVAVLHTGERVPLDPPVERPPPYDKGPEQMRRSTQYARTGAKRINSGHYQYVHPTGKKFVITRTTMRNGKTIWLTHKQTGPSPDHYDSSFNGGATLAEAIGHCDSSVGAMKKRRYERPRLFFLREEPERYAAEEHANPEMGEIHKHSEKPPAVVADMEDRARKMLSGAKTFSRAGKDPKDIHMELLHRFTSEDPGKPAQSRIVSFVGSTEQAGLKSEKKNPTYTHTDGPYAGQTVNHPGSLVHKVANYKGFTNVNYHDLMRKQAEEKGLTHEPGTTWGGISTDDHGIITPFVQHNTDPNKSGYLRVYKTESSNPTYYNAKGEKLDFERDVKPFLGKKTERELDLDVRSPKPKSLVATKSNGHVVLHDPAIQHVGDEFREKEVPVATGPRMSNAADEALPIAEEVAPETPAATVPESPPVYHSTADVIKEADRLLEEQRKRTGQKSLKPKKKVKSEDTNAPGIDPWESADPDNIWINDDQGNPVRVVDIMRQNQNPPQPVKTPDPSREDKGRPIVPANEPPQRPHWMKEPPKTAADKTVGTRRPTEGRRSIQDQVPPEVTGVVDPFEQEVAAVSKPPQRAPLNDLANARLRPHPNDVRREVSGGQSGESIPEETMASAHEDLQGTHLLANLKQMWSDFKDPTLRKLISDAITGPTQSNGWLSHGSIFKRIGSRLSEIKQQRMDELKQAADFVKAYHDPNRRADKSNAARVSAMIRERLPEIKKNLADAKAIEKIYNWDQVGRRFHTDTVVNNVLSKAKGALARAFGVGDSFFQIAGKLIPGARLETRDGKRHIMVPKDFVSRMSPKQASAWRQLHEMVARSKGSNAAVTKVNDLQLLKSILRSATKEKYVGMGSTPKAGTQGKGRTGSKQAVHQFRRRYARTPSEMIQRLREHFRKKNSGRVPQQMSAVKAPAGGLVVREGSTNIPGETYHGGIYYEGGRFAPSKQWE